MKIKNILLAGLLFPAIAFPSDNSFLDNVAAIGSHLCNAGAKVINCGVSTIRKTTDFAANHPYIATPVYIGASWIGLCELYAQKNKKIIKSIEEQLHAASSNPAKNTGKSNSLWNWRISFWKSKENLEQNVQHVIAGLQTDFQGRNKDWFLEKIQRDKALLANMKSNIKKCLREATLTPSLLQMHSKSPFERLFTKWCKKPRNGNVDWNTVKRKVKRYRANRYISGSKYDYAQKLMRRFLFYYEKKAAKLYWRLFKCQRRLDTLEEIINQNM